MTLSKRVVQRTMVAVLGVLGAGAPFVAYASLGGASAQAPGSDMPPIPDAAWTQILDQAGIETFAFDAEAPSIFRPNPGNMVDENTGQTISLDQAIDIVTDATGLTVTPAAASLVSVTTHNYGHVSEVGDVRSVEAMYEGAAVWAIELDQIEVPQSRPFGAIKEDDDLGSTYTTSMIFMVDAYTGQFVVGAQYDPSPTGN